MKRIFTSLAVAAIGLTGYAQSFEGYEASPAPGIVPELTAIEVVFPGCADIDVNSKDDISVIYNGERVEGVIVNAPGDSNVLMLAMENRLVAPGEYTVTIPAYSIGGFNEDYSGFADLESDIILEYLIEGGDSAFAYEVDPVPGVVTELEKVSVVFPGFMEIAILTSDDLSVLYNGTPLENVTVGNSSYGSNDIVFTFPETVKNPGIYTLNIPAGSICGYDAEYNSSDLTENINIEYTIEAGKSDLDFTFTSNPVQGSIVNGLDKVELTFPEISIEKVDAAAVTVTLNGETLGAENYTVAGSDIPEESNMVIVKFNEKIAEGNVVIAMTPGAISGKNEGGIEGSNESEIRLEYTVAAPVVYDLTLSLSTPSKPNENGEISAEKQLDSFFFVADMAGLLPNSDTSLINVTIREVNGDYEAEAHLSKAFGFDQNKSYFSAAFGSQPVNNGEYVVIVEKAAFGNAVWAENPEYGHSNESIELIFTLVDGIEKGTFDIEPLSITPAEGVISATDLSEVSVTFPEGVAAKGKAYATVAGVDVSFLETSELILGEDGTYTATFENIPTELGQYVVSIVAGQFGDADYVAGNGGHGNVEIEVAYTVNSLTGINSAVVETEDTAIYTVTGIRVNSDVRNLPAGIYVINGKKVVIRR